MTNKTDNTAAAFVQVVVDVPVRTVFTYQLPEALRAKVSVGHRLYVPFRNRPRTGLAVALADKPEGVKPGIRIESVLDVLDTEPILPKPLVELLDWVTRYYFSPPGEVLRLILPRPLRVRGKRLVALNEFGQQCLDRGMITDDVARRALEYLRETGRAVDDRSLRKRISRLTLAGLRDLADKGLVEITMQQADALRGRRLVKFLRMVPEADTSGRLGARQRAVLGLLKGRPKVPLDEIKTLTNASSATIRSLIKRGLVEQIVEEGYRDPFLGEDVSPPTPVELIPEQKRAVEAIIDNGRFDTFRSFVLHGITGSGKTEVYIGVIASALAVDKRALLLLPEIALTPQLVAVFRSHFGDNIAVLHSGLTEGERFDQWRRIRRGDVQVVIGARSAIFAPLEDLGVVVVDEEHDGSFKQDSGVRYHARDLALVRGKLERATVILGSATPSLESIQRVQAGKSRMLQLLTRPLGQPLPRVETVDMRSISSSTDPDSSTSTSSTPSADKRRKPLLSPALHVALREVVAAGQQAILFLNRRGHSPFVVCQDCGEARSCPHCEISLTYHRRADQLRCHYCDYSEPQPERCPVCQSFEWAFIGAGTEKLSDQLIKELAGLRVVRLDRDTASGKNLRRILKTFREHRADVLVGTQMVTKGHDFPKVTLVGVVMADLSLRIPDFRSGERTFQLLAQVAGRAGRRDEPGKVIVQTFMPDHPVIQAASQHDFQTFADAELETREALAYPPYGHLIALRFEGPDLTSLNQLTDRYDRAAAAIQQQERTPQSLLRVLGPVEAPIGRLRGRYRWQMLIIAKSRQLLRKFTSRLLGTAAYGSEPEGISVAVDVDPMNLM